jgi:hypothetical protein
MSLSRYRAALVVALLVCAASAATAVPTSATTRTSAHSSTCPIVPFPFIEEVIGPLKHKVVGWQPWGAKGRLWICSASANSAFAYVEAWCHVPFAKALFASIRYEMGKGKKDVVYTKVYGMGDEAALVTFKKKEVLGRTSGLLIRKGKIIFEIIGGVGKVRGDDYSRVRPMAASKLKLMGRGALSFNC